MTDEQAKSLGLRALALGMPCVDGLMDGLWILRVGCYDHPNYQKNDPHRQCGDSWPDFRDPVTEAWLVAWAMPLVSHHPKWSEEGPVYWAPYWRVCIHTRTRRIDEEADTRAEAWINALEQLRGAK